MTACLPDNPAYCFFPHADDEDEPPQIRILVEGLDFAIPTAPGRAQPSRRACRVRPAQPEARSRPHRLDRARRALPARRRRRHERQRPALIPTGCRDGEFRQLQPERRGAGPAGERPAGRSRGAFAGQAPGGERGRGSLAAGRGNREGGFRHVRIRLRPRSHRPVGRRAAGDARPRHPLGQGGARRRPRPRRCPDREAPADRS